MPSFMTNLEGIMLDFLIICGMSLLFIIFYLITKFFIFVSDSSKHGKYTTNTLVYMVQKK